MDTKDKFGETALDIAIRRDYVEIATFLIQETLVRNYKAEQNYKADEPNFQQEKYLTYWNKCRTEIEKMKEHEVANSGVTFFDILVADKKKLASYINNYDIVKVLDEYSCKEEFPIFGDRIKDQYMKGMKGINEKVEVDIALNLSDALNEYTSRMIFDRLDYEEIRNLCIAGYRNLIENRHASAEATREQLVEDDGSTVRSNSSDISVEEHVKCVTPPRQNRI